MFETELFKFLMIERKRDLENASNSGNINRFDIWDEIRKYKEQFEK